jgi:hypothetical protein
LITLQKFLLSLTNSKDKSIPESFATEEDKKRWWPFNSVKIAADSVASTAKWASSILPALLSQSSDKLHLSLPTAQWSVTRMFRAIGQGSTAFTGDNLATFVGLETNAVKPFLKTADRNCRATVQLAPIETCAEFLASDEATRNVFDTLKGDQPKCLGRWKCLSMFDYDSIQVKSTTNPIVISVFGIQSSLFKTIDNLRVRCQVIPKPLNKIAEADVMTHIASAKYYTATVPVRPHDETAEVSIHIPEGHPTWTAFCNLEHPWTTTTSFVTSTYLILAKAVEFNSPSDHTDGNSEASILEKFVCEESFIA